MKVALVSPERIVIVGHSLGAAVTTAVAKHFAKQGIEFAGIVMIAGFMSLPTLFTTYKMGGLIAPLVPLSRYPKILNWLSNQITDTWESASRLASFVRISNRVRLFLIHAINDPTIPWTHAEGLFAAAANATTDGSMSLERLNSMKKRNTIALGDGAFISTWNDGGNKIIREEVVAYGGEYRL